MTRRRGPARVVLAAWATFCVAFVGMWWQMRSGNDPALGKPAATVATAAPDRTHRDRPLLIRRRVIHRVVVVDPAAVVRAAPAAAPAPAVVQPAASAPAPVAPAPAPVAPAPAPAAPAPVTTHSS